MKKQRRSSNEMEDTMKSMCISKKRLGFCCWRTRRFCCLGNALSSFDLTLSIIDFLFSVLHRPGVILWEHLVIKWDQKRATEGNNIIISREKRLPSSPRNAAAAFGWERARERPYIKLSAAMRTRVLLMMQLVIGASRALQSDVMSMIVARNLVYIN